MKSTHNVTSLMRRLCSNPSEPDLSKSWEHLTISCVGFLKIPDFNDITMVLHTCPLYAGMCNLLSLLHKQFEFYIYFWWNMTWRSKVEKQSINNYVMMSSWYTWVVYNTSLSTYVLLSLQVMSFYILPNHSEYIEIETNSDIIWKCNV